MARNRLPIIRIPWRKPKDQKPKPAYDPNLGSGWSPGISDGSWLQPDWVREPLEDIGVAPFHHWVPRRRDIKPVSEVSTTRDRENGR